MNICLCDLPTRKESTLPSRVPTHAYPDCEISRTVKYRVNSLRSCIIIRSSLEYMRLVIEKKNDAHVRESSTFRRRTWGKVHPMHLLYGSHDLVAAKDPNEQSRQREALSERLSPPLNNSGSTQRSSRTHHPQPHAIYRSHMPFDCEPEPNCGPWNICTRIQILH